MTERYSRLHATHNLSKERGKICTCHGRHHKEGRRGAMPRSPQQVSSMHEVALGESLVV